MAKPKLKDFKYVDVWYCDEDGKASPWKRIPEDKVKEFQQEEALNFNCFATVQRYANKTRDKGEAYIAPLYFDLDLEGNIQQAKEEAVKLVDFFIKDLDIDTSDIWVYFSGSKGFHILISSVALGIQPRNDLHKIYEYIAGFLKHRLGQDEPLESVDFVAYSSRRMLRLPNSVHAKTKNFKIPLTVDEIRNLSVDEIKNMANTPRRFNKDEDRKRDIEERPEAAEFYRRKLDEYEQAKATEDNKYDQDKEFNLSKDKKPECVKDLLNNGWKKEGDRNQATVQLACYFKDSGHTKQETLEELEPWVLEHTSAKSQYQRQQRVANTRNVVDSIFSNDSQYKFGCAFIRSLHGPKGGEGEDYDRVACAGDMCEAIEENTEDLDEAEELHLIETGNADYSGKMVKTKVMIAGKKQTPYIVPKRIEYQCWGRDKCKKNGCPLYNIPGGTAYRDLGVYDREIIQFCGIGDDNIKGILKQLSGVKSCRKYDVNVVENTNVEELMVIPKVEDKGSQEVDTGGYVLRTIYAVGDVSHIEENKYYEVYGYVFPHPKNQESTIIVKEAEPLQDLVESFELTDEVKQDLGVFQPSDYTVESINEKLQAIMNDLTYNVTHIVERDETLLAALLVYHSVLRFKVPWDRRPIRGWLESVVIGDTGTGKSALFEKLIDFAGLGTRVNAESTSRTGLTYKMEQNGSGGSWYLVWGAWARADKELIWIDECSGISKEEYGQMTMARSSGKLEVKRAVTAETACRVRAILTGNVPQGKRLADYGQGVEALRDLFNNEDIRRFDFAVFMKSTDVSPELYNRQLPDYPSTIDGDTLKNNILFAWSRTPDQVEFMDEAIDEILDAANSLSDIYGNANDVPLVSPSDQRNKLARLAVGLAALTHSVGPEGEVIHVYPGHVKYIVQYLKACYNSSGCGLNYYSKLTVKEDDLTDEKYEKITEYLKEIEVLKNDRTFYEFIQLFAQQKYLRQSNIEAMLSISKEDAKSIANLLAKLRMIVMTSGGYRKTPRFNNYVAKCFEYGLFDEIDDII